MCVSALRRSDSTSSHAALTARTLGSRSAQSGARVLGVSGAGDACAAAAPCGAALVLPRVGDGEEESCATRSEAVSTRWRASCSWRRR